MPIAQASSSSLSSAAIESLRRQEEQWTLFQLHNILQLVGCKVQDARRISEDLFRESGVGKNDVWRVSRYDFLEKVSTHLQRSHYIPLPAVIRASAAVCARRASVTVLLGGTSGCGKSTLASLLATRLGITTVISTDSIRHVLRAVMSEESNPVLWASTYQTDRCINDDTLKPKAKLAQGYEMQSELVCAHLEAIVSRAERRHESLVVEGVHLGARQMMRLMHAHRTVLPFAIFISNEEKHKERFAVRSKYMTLDPNYNRYIKYLANIRNIQRYILKSSMAAKIPCVDNTNIDRSLALIRRCVTACLPRLVEGRPLTDDTGAEAVHLQAIYAAAQNERWSSKAMLQTILRRKTQSVEREPTVPSNSLGAMCLQSRARSTEQRTPRPSPPSPPSPTASPPPADATTATADGCSPGASASPKATAAPPPVASAARPPCSPPTGAPQLPPSSSAPALLDASPPMPLRGLLAGMHGRLPRTRQCAGGSGGGGSRGRRGTSAAGSDRDDSSATPERPRAEAEEEEEQGPGEEDGLLLDLDAVPSDGPASPPPTSATPPPPPSPLPSFLPHPPPPMPRAPSTPSPPRAPYASAMPDSGASRVTLANDVRHASTPTPLSRAPSVSGTEAIPQATAVRVSPVPVPARMATAPVAQPSHASSAADHRSPVSSAIAAPVVMHVVTANPRPSVDSSPRPPSHSPLGSRLPSPQPLAATSPTTPPALPISTASANANDTPVEVATAKMTAALTSAASIKPSGTPMAASSSLSPSSFALAQRTSPGFPSAVPTGRDSSDCSNAIRPSQRSPTNSPAPGGLLVGGTSPHPPPAIFAAFPALAARAAEIASRGGMALPLVPAPLPASHGLAAPAPVAVILATGEPVQHASQQRTTAPVGPTLFPASARVPVTAVVRRVPDATGTATVGPPAPEGEQGSKRTELGAAVEHMVAGSVSSSSSPSGAAAVASPPSLTTSLSPVPFPPPPPPTATTTAVTLQPLSSTQPLG